MCIPAKVSAWIAEGTYEACNIVNICISGFMKMMAFIIAISYITIVIRYIRYFEQDTKQNARNVLIWLIITIIVVAICLCGSGVILKLGNYEIMV